MPAAPAQRQLPVTPPLDVARVFAAYRDHRLDRVGRAQRARQNGWHTQAQHPERLVEAAHTLRHSAAMALLHAGVDTSVIALWLGHEDPRLHAGLPARRHDHQRASPLRVAPPNTSPGRYRAPDALLAFLDNI